MGIFPHEHWKKSASLSVIKNKPVLAVEMLYRGPAVGDFYGTGARHNWKCFLAYEKFKKKIFV